MYQIYIALRNALILFFIISFVGDGITITGDITGQIVLAVIFGVLMLLVPTILRFFKITVNTGSELLMSTVLSFLFFFVLYTGVGQIAVFSEITRLDLGLGTGTIITLEKVGLLIFLSLVSAVASVGMQRLSEQ